MNDNINNIIANLIEVSHKVITNVRNSNINEAMKNFIDETYLIQILIESINTTESLASYVENVNYILKNLLEALENEDYFLLSDILEFELIKELKLIKQAIDNL